MSLIKVYHLDDDILLLKEMSLAAANAGGYEWTSFNTAKELIDKVEQSPPHLILLDIHLGNVSETGIDVLRAIKAKRRKTAVIMLSGDLPQVRQSLAEGADDFILKSASPTETLLRVANIHRLITDASPTASSKVEAIGPTMQSLAKRVPNIIGSAITAVYIQGESGTGKEVVAQLFEKTITKGQPFVKVNCAAISASLLERELFGHVKGAYTGAIADRPGYIEAASGGWLYLDEVASLTMEAQAALLRALENHEIIRVGDHKVQRVDFRVISASNISLTKLVEDGKFRNDLRQRLCETSIELPPLRDRRGEVRDFLHFFAKSERGGPYIIPPETESLLTQVSWDEGNIRQLRNCIRAMTEKQTNGVLSPMSIPSWVVTELGSPQPMRPASDEASFEIPTPLPTFALLTDQLLVAAIKALRHRQGSISMRQAAKDLGMPKSTLESKIKSIVAQELLSPSEAKSLFAP